MKRKEMVELITQRLIDSTYFTDFDKKADKLLTTLENLGMLPPEVTLEISGGENITYTKKVHQWEE